jgi:hypothetical protein
MRPDLSDLLLLAGVALVTAGVWWIYPPGGLIVLGLFVLVLGIALV